MSYLTALKRANWVRRWCGETQYGLKLGNRGRNGCAVQLLTHTERFLIRDWFLEYGIEKDSTSDLWWSEEKFAYETDIEGSNDVFYHSGVEFKLSSAAYDKIFN
mgnify:FL=1|tara:strand:+ start:323 stop:634 length:312 start_codon:yes stop_codon:yes gene_type:complete